MELCQSLILANDEFWPRLVAGSMQADQVFFFFFLVCEAGTNKTTDTHQKIKTKRKLMVGGKKKLLKYVLEFSERLMVKAQDDDPVNIKKKQSINGT